MTINIFLLFVVLYIKWNTTDMCFTRTGKQKQVSTEKKAFRRKMR